MERRNLLKAVAGAALATLLLAGSARVDTNSVTPDGHVFKTIPAVISGGCCFVYARSGARQLHSGAGHRPAVSIPDYAFDAARGLCLQIAERHA